MIVITGATGNVGKSIAERLLSRGERIRTVSRSTDRLKPLTEKGAEVAVGTLEDRNFVREAFEGAAAVFAMIPPILQAENLRKYQARIGDNIATAIANAGIRYAVNLSSLGAHLSEGSGILLGSYDQEQRLNRIESLNVVHLRPAYFMENFLGSIGRIKTDGIMGSSLRGEVPIPVVATRDIADVAARYLLELNFSGKSVHDLLGERDLTMTEIAKILGRAIGKPNLSYVQFGYEQVKNSMISRGISASVADASIELSKSLNKNPALFDSERTAEKTTETSIEQFADVFLSEYTK